MRLGGSQGEKSCVKRDTRVSGILENAVELREWESKWKPGKKHSGSPVAQVLGGKGVSHESLQSWEIETREQENALRRFCFPLSFPLSFQLCVGRSL